MDANALTAAKAYGNQLKMMQEAGEANEETGGAAGSNFMSLLKDAASDAAGTMRQTEAMQMEAMTGKVDISDLVTAISSAELTLSTVVAVRDRVIGAYQEIIRMPI